MCSLNHTGFIVENRVHRPDGNAAEGQDNFAIILAKLEPDVGFVLDLKFEVGSERAVDVDNRAAHGALDRGGIRSLNGVHTNTGGRQTIQPADNSVDQVRSVNRLEVGNVDVREPDVVAPVADLK